MTATNHALTGTAIGLLIRQPELCLPLAFASHFVCDAIPHFAASDRKKAILSKYFKYYLVVEALLCFLIVAALFYFKPQNYAIASVCAFLAASPDLLWVRKFLAANSRSSWKPNAFEAFASAIQWFQRPIGAVVELAWCIALLLLIMPLLGLFK